MIPLCRWSLPRLCGFPSTDRTGYCLRRPITSSRRASPSFRVSPSNTYPTAATVESSHGLSLPTALQASEVHFSRASPTRYVPSSGFGYPLDGLLPRKPCRFCFAPAALLGFALRRFPLPKGLRDVSAGKNPLAVSLSVTSDTNAGPAGQTSTSRSIPSGSALRSYGFLSRRPPAPPLSFTPSGLSREDLDGTSPVLLSRASQNPTITRQEPPAPQSVNRSSPGFSHRCTGVHDA